MNGTAEFGIGANILYATHLKVMDYTVPTYFALEILASRIPILLPNFGNLIRPLPVIVWITIIGVVFVMSIVFMAINKTYKYIDENACHHGEDRLTKQVRFVDFFIKTFSTITEPEWIPWFPRWSAGKLSFCHAGF